MTGFRPRSRLGEPESCGGSTTLAGYEVLEVINFMFQPITDSMETMLDRNGRADLKALVPQYIWFRIGLGVVRPLRVDDIWNSAHLCYSPYLANLLTRTKYYDMVKSTKGDIADLLEGCSTQWQEGWTLGQAACGDETIVPFKGKRAGNLRQFVPRKPHSTGLKLYCLADSVNSYTVDVYLYTGRRGALRRASWAAGNLSPSGVVYRWAEQLPAGTTLVADSYFGTMEVAKKLAADRIPFLLLTKRNTQGVAALGASTAPGHMRTVVIKRGGFALGVFKNPKVGQKAARVVPFLHNIVFEAFWVTHRLRYRIPPPVRAYRMLAGGVDTANQMALQHRETGRCSTWGQAVRHFLLRYAITNAFATCRQLGVLPHGERMSDFQWACMKAVCGQPIPKPVAAIKHLPVAATRKQCAHCSGLSTWECSGCPGIHLHIKCFAAFHGVGG